jgi:hypothetical protein
MQFLYSLIWTVGAIVDEDGQKHFSNWLREYIKGVYTVKRAHQNGTITDETFKIEATCLIPE